MTIDGFLELLREKKGQYTWARMSFGATECFRHGGPLIRAVTSGHPLCPLEALGTAKRGALAAAEVLGIPEDAADIMSAADGTSYCDRDLRAAMLQILGLPSDEEVGS